MSKRGLRAPFRLRAPDGVVHEVANVAAFVREHPELFAPADAESRRNAKNGKSYSNAMQGLSLVRTGRAAAWKGWTREPDPKQDPYAAGALAGLPDDDLRRLADAVTAEMRRRAPPVRVVVPFDAARGARYSAPWIARVTVWPIGGAPQMEFGRYIDRGDIYDLEIAAAPGSVIRWGQKDHRKPRTSVSRWGVVEDGGAVRRVSQGEARDLALSRLPGDPCAQEDHAR